MTKFHKIQRCSLCHSLYYKNHKQAKYPVIRAWLTRLRPIHMILHHVILLYSWASLVAQMVKNPPAMWEICV